MHFYLRQWDYIFPGHPSMRCCFRWIPPLPGPMSVPAPIMWPPSPSSEYCIPPVSEYVASPNCNAGASSFFFLSLWQNLPQTSGVRKKPVDLPADAYTFVYNASSLQGPAVIKKKSKIFSVFCKMQKTHMFVFRGYKLSAVVQVCAAFRPLLASVLSVKNQEASGRRKNTSKW